MVCDLHPQTAFGLVILFGSYGKVAWDFCLVKPARSSIFFWFDGTFCFFPAVSGPFLISPINWYFVFSFGMWALQRNLLGLNNLGGVTISTVLITPHFQKVLKRKRILDLITACSTKKLAQGARSLVPASTKTVFDWGYPTFCYDGSAGHSGVLSSSLSTMDGLRVAVPYQPLRLP